MPPVTIPLGVPSMDATFAATTVLAEDVARGLKRWAAAYPIMRRVRIDPLARSVAAAAPFASADSLIDTAAVSLWVFALDDLIDEALLPEPLLIHCLDRYDLMLLDEDAGAPDRDDPLSVALMDVRARLEPYPLHAPLAYHWTTALRHTLCAMREEETCRRDGVTPDYATYAARGLCSIGGPPHIASTLVTSDDHSLLGRLPLLYAMERQASLCIRLANDLRSHDREAAVGKANAVTVFAHRLAGQHPEWSASQLMSVARRIVEKEIQGGLTVCRSLTRHVHTDTGRPEQAIVGIAEVVCAFYQQHDFHTWRDEAARSSRAA